MDAKHLFDSLTRQDAPPTTVDVNRAIETGRAIRRRRRTATTAAASAALACVAALTAWVAYPRPAEPSRVTADGSPEPSVTATITVSPSYFGFVPLRKQHPPKGRTAHVPPLLMWVSDAPGKNELFLCESGPNGGGCSGFRPLTRKEYARSEGKLRRVEVWFGFAKDNVHDLTLTTTGGRKVPVHLTRGVGEGLAIWYTRFPPGADTGTLVVTNAKGKTLQRLLIGRNA